MVSLSFHVKGLDFSCRRGSREFPFFYYRQSQHYKKHRIFQEPTIVQAQR
jgi:hypothetical protein